MVQKLKVSFQPVIYHDLIAPKGFLNSEPACHALWTYYTMARMNSEKINETIVVEGDTSDHAHLYNFIQLMRSIALVYGVQPERMVKFWKNVDLTCHVLGLPRLEMKYRLDTVPELKTQ